METNLMKGYMDAYRLACIGLAGRDPAEICLNAAVSLNAEKNAFHTKYLGKVYQINVETGKVNVLNSDEDVKATVKVLLLHYLLKAGNKPLSGKLISFGDLKNGAAIYYPTFYKRAVAPLINAFGNGVEDLYKCSTEIDGVKEKYGHASVTIPVLPMIPVTYVLWEGEEGIPASGTILFDASIEYFLPAEDIVCAGSFGVYELMGIKQKNSM